MGDIKETNKKQVAPLIRPKLCFVHLPPKGKACNKASNFVDREDTNNSSKLMRPLIFQKFLPEYSENQKCAAHNMLRPSFVAVRRHFPPKGKACNKASNFVDREATNNSLKLKRPSSPPLRGRASRRNCLWRQLGEKSPPKGKA